MFSVWNRQESQLENLLEPDGYTDIAILDDLYIFKTNDKNYFEQLLQNG